VTEPAESPSRRALPQVVLVVGTGLVGTSLGLGLRRIGVDVLLSDPSSGAQALACDLGAGRPLADPDGASAHGGAARPDLVVVAAPPDVVAAVVRAQLLKWPDAAVTDVASVKSGPLAELRTAGADLGRYVGGHPLAGRERSGGVAARADLFVGRPWVLTPTVESRPAAVSTVRAMARAVGATVSVMDAEAHDEAVAAVSHVPQVAASLVAARLRHLPQAAVALAGQGIRDVTRIAASDPGLWTQILAGNAGSVGRTLHALRDDLDAVIAAVDTLVEQRTGSTGGTDAGQAARAAVTDLVAAGNEGRSRIPGKHGSAPTRYVSVVVLVPDRPGELARLLGDVGGAGVNIEDLRMEHSEGRPMGLAAVDVVPGSADPLAGALRSRGWIVHA
jgi:prephenate dehydrogenase